MEKNGFNMVSFNEEKIIELEKLNQQIDRMNDRYSNLVGEDVVGKNRKKTVFTVLSFLPPIRSFRDEMVKKLLNERDDVYRDILNLKSDMNHNFIEWLQNQMVTREKQMVLSNRNVKDAMALSQDPNYRVLAILLDIAEMNGVEEKNVTVNNMVCVYESQKEMVEKLIKEVCSFEVKEEKNNVLEFKSLDMEKKNVNDAVIADIIQELRRLEDRRIKQKKVSKVAFNGQKVLKKDYVEYTNLLKILKLLHKANNSKTELVELQENIYVEMEDRYLLENLLCHTKFFGLKKYTEEYNKNKKLIVELDKYLIRLSSKYRTYKKGSLPEEFVKITVPSRRGGTKELAISKNDLLECGRVINLMNLLRDFGNAPYNVMDIAYVSAEKVIECETLIHEIGYFNPKEIKSVEPEISTVEEEKISNKSKNEEMLDSVVTGMMEIIEKSKNIDSNYERIGKYKVSRVYLEKFNLLGAIGLSLEYAKKSEQLVFVKGFFIDQSDKPKFLEAIQLLKQMSAEEPSKDINHLLEVFGSEIIETKQDLKALPAPSRKKSIITKVKERLSSVKAKCVASIAVATSILLGAVGMTSFHAKNTDFTNEEYGVEEVLEDTVEEISKGQEQKELDTIGKEQSELENDSSVINDYLPLEYFSVGLSHDEKISYVLSTYHLTAEEFNEICYSSKEEAEKSGYGEYYDKLKEYRKIINEYMVSSILESENITLEQLEEIAAGVCYDSKGHDGSSYIDSYGVINTIGNRALSKTMNQNYENGTNVYAQFIRPNQYTLVSDDSYKKLIGNTNLIGYQAVLDYLYSRESITDCMSFSTWEDVSYSDQYLVAGGNRYSNPLVLEDRMDMQTVKVLK